MEYKAYPARYWAHLLSIPFIWMMLIPSIILDFFLEVYHHICFPLYGINMVDRGKYIKMDRHKLAYLNWYDKINCSYCAYVNGLFRYASAIAGETERYWCAIKHQQQHGYTEPVHHKEFLPYGDAEAYQELEKNIAEQAPADQS